MTSITINASMQRAYSFHHVINKQQSQARPARSLGTKQASTTHIVTPNIEVQKGLSITEEPHKGEFKQSTETEPCVPKFFDERWKNGTWDLNTFVEAGKMDWDGVIAEARRRKFLELHPEVATNQAPVLFRSSVIPWWAWIMHSHLPGAELLNGRAAMVGFFLGYLVDALTGLDVVGQTGNFICKAGLFTTVIGIMLFRRTKDLENLKNLADEATFYDKQWQASWQDEDASGGASQKGGKDV